MINSAVLKRWAEARGFQFSEDALGRWELIERFPGGDGRFLLKSTDVAFPESVGAFIWPILMRVREAYQGGNLPNDTHEAIWEIWANEAALHYWNVTPNDILEADIALSAINPGEGEEEGGESK